MTITNQIRFILKELCYENGPSGSEVGVPAWSPDGSKIAFTSTHDGNQDIHVMNADGSDPVNLTNHPAVDFWASWSPAVE